MYINPKNHGNLGFQNVPWVIPRAPVLGKGFGLRHYLPQMPSLDPPRVVVYSAADRGSISIRSGSCSGSSSGSNSTVVVCSIIVADSAVYGGSCQIIHRYEICDKVDERCSSRT